MTKSYYPPLECKKQSSMVSKSNKQHSQIPGFYHHTTKHRNLQLYHSSQVLLGLPLAISQPLSPPSHDPLEVSLSIGTLVVQVALSRSSLILLSHVSSSSLEILESPFLPPILFSNFQTLSPRPSFDPAFLVEQ